MLCFDVPPTVAFATGAEKSSLQDLPQVLKKSCWCEQNRNAEREWLYNQYSWVLFQA